VQDSIPGSGKSQADSQAPTEEERGGRVENSGDAGAVEPAEKKRTRWWVIVLAIVLVVVLVGCLWLLIGPAIGNVFQQMTTGRSPQTLQTDDMVLTYPGDWKDLSQEVCEEFGQDPLTECLLGIAHPSGDGTSLNLLRFAGLGLELDLEWADDLLWAPFEASTSDLQVESRESTEYGGEPAVRRVFSLPSSESPSGRAHILQVFVVKGEVVYIFTGWTPSAEAMAEHRPSMEEIITSIRFGALP
jgi:hypothetical protein